jgi:hypothetical protein
MHHNKTFRIGVHGCLKWNWGHRYISPNLHVPYMELVDALSSLESSLQTMCKSDTVFTPLIPRWRHTDGCSLENTMLGQRSVYFIYLNCGVWYMGAYWDCGVWCMNAVLNPGRVACVHHDTLVCTLFSRPIPYILLFHSLNPPSWLEFRAYVHQWLHMVQLTENIVRIHGHNIMVLDLFKAWGSRLVKQNCF